MNWSHEKYCLKLFLTVFAVTLCMQLPVAAEVTNIPNMPDPRVGMCSARIENTIYFIGGAQNLQGTPILNLQGTSTVDSYNFETNEWDTSLAPLQTPRVFACAVVLDGSIYVMGGVDSLGNVLNSVEVYSPESNTWHYASSMEFARKGAAATVYDGHILVFGGGDTSNSLLRQVEAYDPDQGSWKVLQHETNYGRAFHHVALIQGAIYIFGGLGANIGPISVVEEYVPGTGVVNSGFTWRNPRALFGTVTRNDSVIVISGYGQSAATNATAPNGYYLDVEAFDFRNIDSVKVDSIVNWAPLVIPRRGFVAAIGNHGRICLFGGQSYGYKSGQAPIPAVAEIGPVAFTDVRNAGAARPQDFSLYQNYPNPFNPSTVISFGVPAPGSRVSIDVYNTIGQKVMTLVDGYFTAGTHAVTFDGGNLPSGAYIYRLETQKGNILRKMVLIK